MKKYTPSLVHLLTVLGVSSLFLGTAVAKPYSPYYNYVKSHAKNKLKLGGDTFIAVGDNGTVLLSYDDSSWQTVSLPSSASTVNFTSTSYGPGYRAVGNGGYSLISTDSGYNWSYQDTGVTNNLNAIACDFVYSSTCMAAGAGGSVLWMDSDTWTSLTPVTSNALYGAGYGFGAYYEYFFVGANGAMAGYNINNGLSLVSSGSTTTKNLYGVSYLTYNYWAAVGESGTIQSSTDGGSTWGIESINFTGTLRSIAVNPYGMAMIVGDNGEVLTKWVYIQNSWTEQSSATTANLYGVDYDIYTNIWVAVGDGGVIEVSDDGGANWTLLSSGTTENLKAVTH